MREDLPPIFCAIDTDDIDKAISLSKAVSAATGSVKLGLQFFNSHGPQGIRKIKDENPGLPLFLDLKFHDIPNTVAAAVRAVVPLEPTYINVHAAGGLEMMVAAKKAATEEAARLGVQAPMVLAVTILTSLDEDGITDIGFAGSPRDNVVKLAKLTQQAGLDGIVCSPHEIKDVRKACGNDFVLMVPGIRPASHQTGSDDQKRIMTPADALGAGATHLVIGRPITQADDPERAAMEIMETIPS